MPSITIPRDATPAEITAAGWIVDGSQCQSPTTGAGYAIESMRVALYRTDPDTGHRLLGPWIYLSDDLPMAESFVAPMSAAVGIAEIDYLDCIENIDDDLIAARAVLVRRMATEQTP